MANAFDPFASMLGHARGAARDDARDAMLDAPTRVRQLMTMAKRLPPVPIRLDQRGSSRDEQARRVAELCSLAERTFALRLKPGWLRVDSPHAGRVRVLYVWSLPERDLDDFFGLLASFTGELDDWTWLRLDAGSPYELGSR